MTIIDPIRPPIIAPMRGPFASGALPWEGGGGVAPFTPDQEATAKHWYRADDVVLSGSSITTLTDKIGSANLPQATGTAQATQVTRAGQLAASFDGGDWYRGAFGATYAQPTTIYIVYELAVLGAASVFFDGDDTTNRQQYYTATAEHRMYAGLTVTGPSTAATDTIYAGAFVFNGASSEGYINDFRTGQAVLSGNANTRSIDGFTVGGNSTASPAGLINGYIWEIVFCTGAHDATKRRKFGGYLTARYTGLTVTT